MGDRRPVLLFAAAVLLLVVVAARGASPVPSAINDVSLDRGLPPVYLGRSNLPGNGPLSTPADPQVLAKVMIALLVVFALLAIGLSVLSAVRERRRQIVVANVTETVEGTIDTVPRLRLEDAVREARDLLARKGGAPRDAVIEAWVTLENATEHRREPHETATEFTVALLEKQNADEVALRELRTLYQRARFGAGAVGDDSADRARDALDRILVTIR